MAMYKRYNKVKKRYKNFFSFYIVLVFVIFTSYTFSRYTTTVNTDKDEISVAKFSVTVNGQHIGSSDPFQIQLSPNSNTYNNKIAPDVQGGYFEIVIDPTGTEVSLEYELTFNLSNISQKMNIIKYTINNGQEISVTNNIIKGDILLPSSESGFEAKDSINIKAYWEWNEDIINPTITNSNNINVTSIIRQKIN